MRRAAALLCAALIACGAAAKQERLAAKDGAFEYRIPEGFRKDFPGKGSVAGWEHAKDGTKLGVFPVAEKRARGLGGARKAAEGSRKAAEGGAEKWTVSKLYKKDLDSGLTFFFYTAQRGEGPHSKVSGYFELAGGLYFVNGWAARAPHGLPGVYAALATIEPIARPRRQGKLLDGDKPDALRDQEEKDAGVPLR